MSTVFLEEIGRLQPKVPPGQESDQNEFTGERFLPGYRDGSIELQHLHRYSFALQFVIDKTVLDIACGEGYGCELMGQVAREVIGIDVDAATIDLAQKRYTCPNLSFRTGTTDAIPLGDESVDVVVSFETIEHVNDQNAFWCEIKRVLRKGGVLVISSPNADVYNRQRARKNPFHIRELSKEELVHELSKRFVYHQRLSQANVFGSFLRPASNEPGPLSVISVDPNTRILTWQTASEVQDPFCVAVASDEFQPLAHQSLYTGTYPADAMPSLVGGIVARDRGLRDLERQVRNLEVLRDTQVGAAQRERDQAIETGKRTEEHLRGLIAVALSERDDAMESAKRAEERLLNDNQNLLGQRDHALKIAERVRKTVAEQDGVIKALRMLVDEYTKQSLSPDKVNGVQRSWSSEK